jgi:DNA-binding transcriptional regulator LsrR (DeoR family)
VGLKIGVSGGPLKRNATLAVAKGKWVDVLVTDSETANFLLNN